VDLPTFGKPTIPQLNPILLPYMLQNLCRIAADQAKAKSHSALSIISGVGEEAWKRRPEKDMPYQTLQGAGCIASMASTLALLSVAMGSPEG
jgi:hypothetical protein